MGDMGEIFLDYTKYKKERSKKRRNKNIPILIEMGAVELTDGVWKLEDLHFYPKGWARNFITNKKYDFQQGLDYIKNKKIGGNENGL